MTVGVGRGLWSGGLGVLLWLSLAPMAFGAETLRLGGSGSGLGTFRQVLAAYHRKHPEVTGEVAPSLGSGGGIKALLAGVLDLALSARPLTPEESAKGIHATPYGRTPLVFIVGKDVLVDGLARWEIGEILGGQRRAWPTGDRIRLLLRPSIETSTKLVEEAFPEAVEHMTALRHGLGVPIANSDQDAADLLESVPGVFGFLAQSVALGENRQVRILAVDGVAPGPVTLADGRYPWSIPLYLVTTDSPSAVARDFMAFVRQGEGRAILERCGHMVIDDDVEETPR